MSRLNAFLQTFDREFATTMRVLRAYPEDKLDLRPAEKSKTARELAWVFALEGGLGVRLWNDEVMKMAGGAPPAAPASWSELLAGVEQSQNELRSLVAGASDADLDVKVKFLTAPKTMGEWSRHEIVWMLLHDQIHHRGQFSVYLRMAGARVPSIYGPTADEQWI